VCGIAGFIDYTRAMSRLAMVEIAEQQGQVIEHRGPDSSDIFVQPEAGLALSHRRLAIIDLSTAGRQPMTSSCGRLCITYNGEIYNAAEIRKELQACGRAFRGLCDTEVLLEACAEWGIGAALQRFIGMFAFAIWDRELRVLTLARDRMGIKPLYYARSAGGFAFGSELKAIGVVPQIELSVDPNALTSYLRYSYVPAPNTIYKNVFKLLPGTTLVVSSDRERQHCEPQQYWSFHDVALAGSSSMQTRSDAQAVEVLDDILGDAVRRRMVADVPLGVFLSGGVDSSTVAAMMQEASSKPVKSFTVGFEQTKFSEAGYAAAVARHLGTDHTELYVTHAEAQDVIPKLAAMYDEPFSDSSQIPTYLISALTRNHVTVALSGDGGDELFAGYYRYQLAERVATAIRRTPARLRRALGRGLGGIPTGAWDRLFKLVPAHRRPPYAGDKVHKFAQAFGGDETAFYRRLISQWAEPSDVAVRGTEIPTVLWDPELSVALPNFLDRMQYWDTLTYLPGDILTKVDRASMAASLEVRVPILDHRVVEFAWSVPREQKIRNGDGKWLLKQVLYKRVPKQLIDRPKMGFGVPIDEWLRGPLQEWAGDLLSAEALQKHGFLRPEPVQKLWREHLRGGRNWAAPLWNVLMLQSWCETYL
jgi:asparagine synthase (glutamine-hydrolysing)